MSFETDFPSLQGERRTINNYGDIAELELDKFGETILIEDIQQHCLDKAKVREQLGMARIFSIKYMNSIENEKVQSIFAQIEKELGL